MKTSVKTLYEKITKAAQYRCWTPIGDKHLNESWNWFAAKSSIQGALLVQLKFSSPLVFSDLTDLPWVSEDSNRQPPGILNF